MFRLKKIIGNNIESSLHLLYRSKSIQKLFDKCLISLIVFLKINFGWPLKSEILLKYIRDKITLNMDEFILSDFFLLSRFEKIFVGFSRLVIASRFE